MENKSEYELNIWLFRFLILICIYFNCSFSLPIKDSSAEYSSENFSCTLYCSRDHIFLYELLPCNLHRWRREKRIHNRSEYILGSQRLFTVLWSLWFSFELCEVTCNQEFPLSLKKKYPKLQIYLYMHTFMFLYVYFCGAHTHTLYIHIVSKIRPSL